MKNYPSLRQLQYFLSLCRSLSFSKAAEDCFVTQSTLSAGIKELEALLKEPLVERSSRHVQLTAFGRHFKKEAERLLHMADQMLDPINRKDSLAGTFYLGMIPTITPYFAPMMLEQIKKQYPNLSVVLSEDLTEHLLTKLRAGHLDAVVMALPYEIGSLQKHIYTDDQFILALPKNYKHPKKAITRKDLNDFDLLLLEDGHCLSDHAINACGLSAKLKKQKHSLSSVVSLLSLCTSENKGTLITRMMLKPLQHLFPDFHFIDIEDNASLTRDIALIWRNTGPEDHFLQNIFDE